MSIYTLSGRNSGKTNFFYKTMFPFILEVNKRLNMFYIPAYVKRQLNH